jgi:hypothetical protein
MRKYCAYLEVLAILVFGMSVPTQAQEATSKLDVFGGFSFLDNNYTGWNGAYTIKGYHFSGTYNLTNHLGFMADISGHSNTSDELSLYTDPTCACPGNYMNKRTLHLEQNLKTFAFGPSFTTEAGKMRLSAHVLAGFSRGEVKSHSVGQESWDSGTTWNNWYDNTNNIAPNTGLAVVLGGSADYMFKPKFGWRILQVDYMRSVLQGCDSQAVGIPTNPGTWTPSVSCDYAMNNVRLSTGIVFRFGAK